MMPFTCQTCSVEVVVDEIPPRGEICFKCHIQTVNLGFTYGKEVFHGPTITELQRKTVSDAKINGYDAQPVTNWM
jgi:hypothetical protein